PGFGRVSTPDWSSHRQEIIKSGAITQEVDLQKLGINPEEVGRAWREWNHLTSSKLERFYPAGGEGIAFHTPDKQFVYKLFVPTSEGIGGYLQSIPLPDGRLQVSAARGTIVNLLQCIALMGKLGSVPIEVVGMTKDGIVVTKMPYGNASGESIGAELERIRAFNIPRNIVVPPKEVTEQIDYYAVIIDNKPYIITDIGPRNVVNNTFGEPRLLDFFIGEIPDIAMSYNPDLNDLVNNLKAGEQWAAGNLARVRFSKTPRANPFETPEGRALFYRVEQAYKPGHGTRSFWKPCARPLT
ncbi:MAG: hypothetical protein WC299_13265, partial [Kiritimatiellia bacterium]